MKPLTLGVENKSYTDRNQSVENEQYVSPTTQDLYTALATWLKGMNDHMVMMSMVYSFLQSY